jgi:RNA polymerase sigma-70 factor (sigma-E family)
MTSSTTLAFGAGAALGPPLPSPAPGSTGPEPLATFTVPQQRQRSGDDTVREQEREAFDAFVRARLPELLRFGQALTGSPEAAADLVQDALERTLLAWSRLESRDAPEGYVRRIMVNRNISIWRKFGRERAKDPIEFVDERGAEDHHVDGDLWRALQQLPPKQRAVVALRYYEDMSEADIARTLGCSVGTVKSQASKALAKLRVLVPQDAGEV